MGVGFGIAVGIGATIGASILRTPGDVATQLRSAWLVMTIWVLGGIYAFFGTVSVTELATMLPHEGGWYVYSREAFGEYAGFLVGCCDWTMQAAAVGYLAVAFGEFSVGLRPEWAPHLKSLAVGAVVVLTAVNWLGLRSSSRLQELTSLIKTLALFAFVVACLVVPGGRTVSAAPALPAIASSGGILLAIVIAMQAVIATYDGWYSAIYFLEEDKDPVRNLPRSAIGGVVVCIAIFLLVNLALLHVLTMSRLDRLLPPQLSSVNTGGTPTASLLMCAVVSIALVATGSFETLIAIATFLFVTVYISGFAALFRLRRTQPEMARPFKTWGYPWTTAGVLLASIGFLVAAVVSDLKHSLFTLVLIAVNYPIYYFFIRKHTVSGSRNLESRG